MSGSIQFAIFLAALLALSLSAGSGSAQECTDLPQSDLKLYRLESDHVTEHAATPEEIERLARTSGMARAPHPLMAVVSPIAGKFALAHRLVPAPGGGYCDAPEAVIIGIGIASREVFLTPPAAMDACVKAALLAHEGEHDRMLGAGVQAFIQEYRPAFAQELVELTTKRASDQGSAKKAFEAGIMASLTRMLSQFKEEQVGQIRQAVDSAPRLAELRRSCEGRLDELEKSVRHDGKGL